METSTTLGVEAALSHHKSNFCAHIHHTPNKDITME